MALTHLRDLVCVVDLHEPLWVIRGGMVSIQIPACLPALGKTRLPLWFSHCCALVEPLLSAGMSRVLGT